MGRRFFALPWMKKMPSGELKLYVRVFDRGIKMTRPEKLVGCDESHQFGRVLIYRREQNTNDEPK